MPKKNPNYQIEEYESQFTLIKNHYGKAKSYLTLFGYFLLLSLFAILLIIGYFTSTEFQSHIDYGLIPMVLAIALFPGFYLLGYFYYRYQIQEWSFDKGYGAATFLENSASRKAMMQISISTIKKIIYYQRGPFDKLFYLSFMLNNIEEVKIFSGQRAECEEIGNKLGLFLHLPFTFKDEFKNRFILLDFSLILLMGILIFFIITWDYINVSSWAISMLFITSMLLYGFIRIKFT